MDQSLPNVQSWPDAYLLVQKAPCENKFRAIANALLASKACDITGLVAIACARHGCYAPNALVDLFLGEQQKNVDFAFIQALKTMGVDPEQGVLFIYDIVCQYIIYLLEHISAHLPHGMSIDWAIGLFHVHNHKEDCFFHYAPTFIPGSGIVAGEILESLWSSLNSISPTVRTATLPHRAEMLDDHATDSNHKKMLGMAVTLCSKYREALETSTKLSKHHVELTATFGNQAVGQWEDEVIAAEAVRLADVKVMDVYATRAPAMASGSGSGSGTGLGTGLGTGSGSGSALDSASTVVQSVEEWIDFAICVEEMQYAELLTAYLISPLFCRIDLRHKVRRLGKSPQVSDVQFVERERQALASHMITLTQLQSAANVGNHQIAPSCITADNEAELTFPMKKLWLQAPHNFQMLHMLFLWKNNKYSYHLMDILLKWRFSFGRTRQAIY